MISSFVLCPIFCAPSSGFLWFSTCMQDTLSIFAKWNVFFLHPTSVLHLYQDLWSGNIIFYGSFEYTYCLFHYVKKWQICGQHAEVNMICRWFCFSMGRSPVINEESPLHLNLRHSSAKTEQILHLPYALRCQVVY